MKRNKISLVVIFLLGAFILNAQVGVIKKANKDYENYSYETAIERFESVTVKSTDVNRKLADCYFNVGDLSKSEEYYAEVVKADDFNSIDYYNYSTVLLMNKKYDEAENWLGKFNQIVASDSRGEAYVNSPDFHKDLQKDKGRFVISNLNINSDLSDFGASYYKENVVFASSREKRLTIRRVWNWNQLPFLNLYIADVKNENEVSNLREFEAEINKKYHEGPASFNKAGDFVVFTRNNYNEKDTTGVVRLELYSMSYEADKWSQPKAFPFNNRNYSVGHPSLTQDGKTMYFASDMPGGLGGVDIYITELLEDGSWTQPVNLGSTVNTEGDEMFPFVHEEENMMFFASNGQVGLGGLDIFIIQLKSGETTGKIENLGAPVNTNMDDFALILDFNQKSGYFSSNREGGKGDDDIYSFKLLKPFSFGTLITGTAFDTKGNALPNIEIKLYDSEGNVVETYVTDNQGKYNFTVEKEKDYNLTGKKEDYFDGNKSFSTASNDDEIIADVILEKDPGFSLYGLITDNKTKEVIEGVKITLIDKATDESELINTSDNGEFLRVLENSKINDKINYTFILEKEGYFSKTIDYSLTLDRPGQFNVHETLDFSMDVEVKDLTELVKINPIYFDLNKYNIREDAAVELDKIVDIMNKYPNMVVELGSHTDCRAPAAYNRTLSDNRAKASADYIKGEIVNPDRITGKGYGESQLINKCECEGSKVIPCTEEEHQENRRTEFKVISTGNDKVKVVE